MYLSQISSWTEWSKWKKKKLGTYFVPSMPSHTNELCWIREKQIKINGERPKNTLCFSISISKQISWALGQSTNERTTRDQTATTRHKTLRKPNQSQRK